MIETRHRGSFQFQITAYFVAFAILAINLVGWILYVQVRDYFDDDLGNTLVGIAKSSADLVEEDLLPYLKPGAEKGQFYKLAQDVLITLQGDFEVSRIYVVDLSERILVDTSPGSTIGSTVPHLKSNISELSKALDMQPVYSTLYRGFDGSLYKSAFAPITDRDGLVVAVACVDASPAFLQTMDRIRNAILIINLVSFVIASLLGILFARQIVNPLKSLVGAAQRLSRGDFSEPVGVSAKNEIGFLGEVFNTMQENVRSQQEHLEGLKKSAESRADTLQTYNEYILKSIDSGILTINLDGLITVMNNKAGEFLKVESETAIHRHYETALGLNHPMIKIVRRAIKHPRSPAIMEETLDYEVDRLILAIQFSPLRDINNAVIGTNWVLTDISELRKLQEDIKEKERMAYLGMLSAAVAHEIRNPLNSIELFIGLLKRQLPHESKQLGNIKRVQEEIRALNAIVTNILNFAKPTEPEYQTFKVSRLLNESIFLAEDSLLKKNIRTHISLPADDPLVSGDLTQLKQVMLNIILNSTQAMEQGGDLTLSLLQNGRAGDRHQIRISDTGKGIPATEIQRIFEPFFSTRSQGTGLGLAIVRNIITAHHGDVFVESEPGKGTTFFIELPKESEQGND